MLKVFRCSRTATKKKTHKRKKGVGINLQRRSDPVGFGRHNERMKKKRRKKNGSNMRRKKPNNDHNRYSYLLGHFVVRPFKDHQSLYRRHGSYYTPFAHSKHTPTCNPRHSLAGFVVVVLYLTEFSGRFLCVHSCEMRHILL